MHLSDGRGQLIIRAFIVELRISFDHGLSLYIILGKRGPNIVTAYAFNADDFSRYTGKHALYTTSFVIEIHDFIRLFLEAVIKSHRLKYG